jgi:hypothetical protein
VPVVGGRGRGFGPLGRSATESGESRANATKERPQKRLADEEVVLARMIGGRCEGHAQLGRSWGGLAHGTLARSWVTSHMKMDGPLP